MQRIPLARQLLAVVLTVAFAASSASTAFAAGGQTGSISGTIVQASNQAPLNNVAVTAASPSNTYHATTDAAGKFSITGVLVDTYTVSFQLSGYEPTSFSGVTVQGDAQVAMGTVALQRRLTEIGHVTSRSSSGAFQPSQTTDQYTVNQQRIEQALGKKDNVSETNLILSVPGTQTNAAGALAIRGSQRTQLSYQFDGINYTEPLSNQFENNLFLNGVSSLQVVPGAGDATQGNAGSGVINIIPKRGTRPPFGLLDAEANLFPRFQQYALEYGWASENGRWSDYISYIDQKSGREYGYRGADAANQGTYFSTSGFKASDLINNLVYKFGHNNSQSLQLLTQNRYSAFYGNYGGINGLFFPDNAPDTYAALGIGLPGRPSIAQFQQILAFYPGLQTYLTQPVTAPQNTQTQPLGTVKLEYRNNVNASTYYAARIYRTIANAYFEGAYSGFASTSSQQNIQGGTRNGISAEFTKQLNDKHLLTLVANYEHEKPVFMIDSPVRGYRSIAGTSGAGGTQWRDFLNPATVGQPISAANPCPVAGGCYLYQFFPNGTPPIPPYGINTTTPEQNFGAAIRDQITLNTHLKLDVGLRYDGANFHLPNAAPYQVPVAPGPDSNTPRVWEPRFAAAWQPDRSDAWRFSYGRSVQFPSPSSIFTPINQDNFRAFQGIPVNPAFANICGADQAHACTDYANLLYWQQNNAFDFPELTPLLPATFNNFDLGYSHLFANGWGVKVTPFFTRGYNVQVITSDIIGTNPATGAPLFGPGTPQSKGLEKTTGVEFYVTTPDRPQGWSGFLSATYVNKITNVPPTNGFALEDFFPSIPSASLAAGNLYRVGYLTPLFVRSGVTYKHSGWKVNPVFSYDRGYPYGNGLINAFFVRGVATNVPTTNVTAPFGSAGSSQYIDPANPGSMLNPNIAATRGTPEGAQAGSQLTHPRLNMDLTVEFTPVKPKGTIGLALFNVFNQIYSEPVINTRYQPVASGVAGPQTGQNANAANPVFYNVYGQRNFGPDQFGFDPYRLVPTNTPRTLRLYYQLPF